VPNTNPPAIDPKPYSTPIVPTVDGFSLIATVRNVGYTSCVPCEKLMNAVMSRIKNKNVGRNFTSSAAVPVPSALSTPARRAARFCAPASHTGDSPTRACT
jgi:hypothetical protein